MLQTGRILSCVGGLYTVENARGRFLCYAKGNFRIGTTTPVAGDFVEFEEAEGCAVESRKAHVKREEYGKICKVLPRKNHLIRPPLANLDLLFLVLAVKDPLPSLFTLDKLCAIACHNKIRVVVVCNKSKLDPEKAGEIVSIYRKVGFPAFSTDFSDPEATRKKLLPCIQKGSLCAFTGASGVGKSTLLNALFPELAVETGSISQKTARGKHTTRQSLLFDISASLGVPEKTYIADTPGFSLLDFQRFFFMEKEDLPFAFPEFEPYLGACKYTKCSHTTEEGCKILAAVQSGVIPSSRHESYCQIYSELKSQNSWEKKSTHR